MSEVFFSSANKSDPRAGRSSSVFGHIGDAILKMEAQNRAASDLGIETSYHVATGDSRDFGDEKIK